MKQIDVTSEITKLFYNLFNHTDKIINSKNNSITFKINDNIIELIYCKSSKESSCKIKIDVEEEYNLLYFYSDTFSKDSEFRFKIFINGYLCVLPKFDRVEEAKLLDNFENMILEYKHSQINKLLSLTSEDEEL